MNSIVGNSGTVSTIQEMQNNSLVNEQNQKNTCTSFSSSDKNEKDIARQQVHSESGLVKGDQVKSDNVISNVNEKLDKDISRLDDISRSYDANIDMETTTIDSNQPESPIGNHPPKSCRYQSKRCDNPRALKKNGQLHNLCEFHRVKANSNQRKLDRKKRREAQVLPYMKRGRFEHGVPPRVSGYPFPHLTETGGEQRYTDLSTDDFQFLVQCFASAGEQQMHQQHLAGGEHESLQNLLFDRNAAVHAYEREKISLPREARYPENHSLEARYPDSRHMLLRHMEHRHNMEGRHKDSRLLDDRQDGSQGTEENWRSSSLPPFVYPMVGHGLAIPSHSYSNHSMNNYVSFEQWCDDRDNARDSNRGSSLQPPAIVNPKK